MIATIASIFSLLFGIGVLLLGSGLLGTLLGVRAGIEQFPDWLIGVVMSAFFIGYVVGSYLCPPLVRKVGHIRSFAAMAAVAAAAMILHGLWVHPLVWWLLRIVTGICMVGLYLVIESWLNEQATAQNRGKVFAAYMTVTLFSLGAAQYLLLVYGAEDTASFALGAMFFALALVPVALTRVREPAPVPVPQLNFRRLLSISPLGAAGALGTGIGAGAFWGMGALFAHSIGLAEFGIAAFMSAVILGGALLQFPIGHFSDHRDRRTVMLWVTALGAIAITLGWAAVHVSTFWLFVAAVLYGGFSFSVYSLAVAHTNDHLQPGEILEATKGLLLLYGIGASIGPLIAGVLMNAFGASVLLLFLAATLAVLAAYTYHRMHVSRAIPVAEQAEFVPMARTSPAAAELDPRTELEPELDLEPSQPPPTSGG